MGKKKPTRTRWKLGLLAHTGGPWLGLNSLPNAKSRTGSQWVKKRVLEGYRHIALIAPTASDVRDIMVEGLSGILNVFPEYQKPKYEPSKRRITFHTGAKAILYSGDEPERLRGCNVDSAWIDELGSARYPDMVMNMLALGLRIGNNPRCVITTTPKPIKEIKELLTRKNVHITRGSSYENRDNLSPIFFDEIISSLENTRLGRQEIYAEILEDVVGALWNRKLLDDTRVRFIPDLSRIIVSVDPAISSKKTSNETGIVVVGLGTDGHGYVLDDFSLRDTPDEWAKKVVKAYYQYNANNVVAESNQGGEMVAYTIKTIDEKVPVKLIHANRGKFTRAEPVSALYSQGKVHHIGTLPILEDQLCSWVPGEESPDRLDAMVHGLTEIMVNKRPTLSSKTLPNLSQANIWR